MAAEARRGCGYRKIGGLYLVSDAGGQPCDRLPFPLTVCPTCSCGIKQTRGWTWVNARALFGGAHLECNDDRHRHWCPVCSGSIERAGLLWIGERFYKTPGDFLRESDQLGVSRRVTAVPRGFKVGETWILFAHPKAIVLAFSPKGDELPGDVTPGIFQVWKPQRIEKILPDTAIGSEEARELEEQGITPVFLPANDPDHRGTVYDDEPELALGGAS